MTTQGDVGNDYDEIIAISGELGDAVAHQIQQRLMPRTAGCQEGTMHGAGLVVVERPAREVGHDATGFVH